METPFILILTWHSDPAHEWLEVPNALIQRFGILDDISEYSYYDIDTQTMYLEGDCDAGVLIDQLKANNIEVVYRYKEYNRDCFVRKLPRLG